MTLDRRRLIIDARAALTAAETGDGLPFIPERYFVIFDVPNQQVRGEHAHRECHELLVCARGECTVMADDGTERAEVVLDRPEFALHLPPPSWTAQYYYSADAVLMALCSHPYEPDDYLRTYDDFTEFIAGY